MELHPTIIAASGEAATQISSSLEEQWGTTLGDGAEVLAFAVPAKCERWAQAIRQIHDAARVARLQRLGYWIDPAINAVWLAELHDPELPRLLSSLEAGVQTGLTQGRELRAHLLLLMPDLFDASPDQQERARENLELLRPTSDALFATRVWPVSARNRADLYLRDPPDDLLPLVQHFVEACLFRSFPFHPNGCRGRDWGGVGCCSFVIGKPSARNLSAYVWTEIKRTIVGPPTSTWQGTVGPALGGELLDLPATFGKDPDRTRFPQQFDNVSGPLLDIPSCPWCSRTTWSLARRQARHRGRVASTPRSGRKQSPARGKPTRRRRILVAQTRSAAKLKGWNKRLRKKAFARLYGLACRQWRNIGVAWTELCLGLTPNWPQLSNPSIG